MSEISTGRSRRFFLGSVAAGLSLLALDSWTALLPWRTEQGPQIFRYTCRIRNFRSFAEHEADRSRWENFTFVSSVNQDFRNRGWLLNQTRTDRVLNDGLEITWTYEFVTADAARKWEYTMLDNIDSIWPKWGEAQGFEAEIHRTYRINT